jgi:hypothetical protein
LCLAHFDHHEQALVVIQESVDLYRQLAADCPSVLNAKLAKSLKQLSICLSRLGLKEQMEQVIEEEAKISGQLAAV